MIERRSRLARMIAIELPILAVVLFAIAPYAWMVLTSIRPDADLSTFPLSYVPSQVTLEHYATLLQQTSFLQNLGNSLVIAAGAVVVGLLTSVPAAYAFSRFRFRGRQMLMTQFLVINMFPVVLLIIPLFVLMRNFHLLDSYFGIIIGHSTFAIPFAVWMLTSYMNGIPREVDEAR